jgi:hypothetical protein
VAVSPLLPPPVYHRFLQAAVGVCIAVMLHALQRHCTGSKVAQLCLP